MRNEGALERDPDTGSYRVYSKKGDTFNFVLRTFEEMPFPRGVLKEVHVNIC